MKETTLKGEEFYRNWQKQRKNKWLYLFLHGSLYWGIPMAIVFFLTDAHFEIANMHFSVLFKGLIITMIAGLGFGWSQFKRIDSIYLSLNDENEISKGIQSIELGEKWNYENLFLFKDTDETLTIQNQLLWLNDNDREVEQLRESLDMVYEDYKRLKKNADFDQFMTNRDVKIQLIDPASDKETLLMEKFLAKNQELN
jgi:hypothetical protein